MKKLLLTIAIFLLLTATVILPLAVTPTLVIAADVVVDEQVGAGNCDAHEKDNDSSFSDTASTLYIRSDTSDLYRWNSGFVFTTVAVPKDATISSAYLEIYIVGVANDDMDCTIYGNDVDDANNFDAEADVTSRTTTTASVSWAGDSLGFGWATSPDISGIITELTSRAGWATGQDMCILAMADNAVAKITWAYSYISQVTLAAKLHIEYECVPSAAPDGTTNDATQVESTTARLNSYVSDDKDCPEDVEVRFSWDDDMAGAPYAQTTAWVDGYSTGDYPYTDLTGLTLGTQHWFRAEFKNPIGTTNGAEKTFTTDNAVSEPENLMVSAASSTVAELHWTKGTGATNTYVRRKVGSSPADETDGTGVYASTLSTCQDTGLTAGTTYYYRAWGESGAVFSVAYAEMMLTMPMTEIGAGGSLTAPSTPARWFQSPNPDLVSSIPGVILLDNAAIALDMPQATVYVIFFILIAIVAGIVIYVRIQNIPVAIITVSVVMVVMSAMGILPLWMIFVFIIMGTSAGYALARG